MNCDIWVPFVALKLEAFESRLHQSESKLKRNDKVFRYLLCMWNSVSLYAVIWKIVQIFVTLRSLQLVFIKNSKSLQLTWNFLMMDHYNYADTAGMEICNFSFLKGHMVVNNFKFFNDSELTLYMLEVKVFLFNQALVLSYCFVLNSAI